MLTLIKKLGINKNLIMASAVLLVGSGAAALSHYVARIESDFRFTILGFAAAIFTGMFYGLSVEGNKTKANQNLATA